MIEHLKNKAAEKTDWGDGGSCSHRSRSRGEIRRSPEGPRSAFQEMGPHLERNGEENSHPLQYLAWRIPWTEEPVGLLSIGLQSRTRLKQLSMYACIRKKGKNTSASTKKKKKPERG